MREIVLDTETTGLKYRSGDRIIEVGCVELINHIPTGQTLQFYCSVNKKIDKDATRVHGLTNEFLAPYPSFADQVEKLLEFIDRDDLIIHNADFDLGFINNELYLLDLPKLKNKTIDTVPLARKTLNTRIANLDYLCRRFSIDLGERDLHGALLDSQLLAEVYLELIGGKQISMNLSSTNDQSVREEKKIHSSSMVFSKIKMSEEDVSRHKVAVKQIKSPLWRKIDY